MPRLIPHITEIDEETGGQLTLNTEVIRVHHLVLEIRIQRPDGSLRRRGGNISAGRTRQVPALILHLIRIRRQKRLREDQVPLGPVVKRAEAATNDGLAAKRRPRETEARHQEILSVEKSSGNSRGNRQSSGTGGAGDSPDLARRNAVARANQTIELISRARNDQTARGNGDRLGRIVECRHEIRHVVRLRVDRNVMAVSHTNHDAQILQHSPGVFDIPFVLREAEEPDGIAARFGVRLELADRGVRERVSGRVGIGRICIEHRTTVIHRPPVLVLPVADDHHASLQQVRIVDPR